MSWNSERMTPKVVACSVSAVTTPTIRFSWELTFRYFDTAQALTVAVTPKATPASSFPASAMADITAMWGTPSCRTPGEAAVRKTRAQTLRASEVWKCREVEGLNSESVELSSSQGG